MTPKLIWLFLTSLPDLIKLLQALEKALQERETAGKVKDDLKTIHAAFQNRDPKAITALFSNGGDGSDSPSSNPPYRGP